MKKKFGDEESENEFSVDEPDEFQGSDDDWTPGAVEGGRRQSRRLRNSNKKPRLMESNTSDEEDSDDSDDSETEKKRGKKGKPAAGRGKLQVKTITPKEAESVVSCEATSTTSPVEKEFSSGAFVVAKKDFESEGDPPIWKIDGKALLQKYVPYTENGKVLYKNTSTYSGWSIANKDLYYPAPIAFKMQNRKDTIVEFLKENIKASPASHREDSE